MAGTIGIKIANGDFYPVLTRENSTEKKRLILTTAHDRQESVQIDLFKSGTQSMLDAFRIGSLVVDNIKPRPRGEPSIEMTIESDADGNISAEAWDVNDRGGSKSLHVSQKNMDSMRQPDGFSDFNRGSVPQSPINLYDRSEPVQDEERKFPWLIMVCATLFVIVVIALLWFFFLGGRDRLPFAQGGGRPAIQRPASPVETPAPQETRLPPPVVEQALPAPPPEPLPLPPVEAAPAEPESSPEPVPPAELAAPPELAAPMEPASPAEPVVIEAPQAPPPVRPQTVERTRPSAPVSSYKVPVVIPGNGVVYQIRWGDTLWDISEAFYRNPWLYPRIARFNKISNPDHIIAGSNVRIPPLN